MDANKEKSEFELIIDLLQHWIRHWYYFVIGLLLCGAIGLLYYKLKTPEFQINATVALRADDNIDNFAGMSVMKSLGFAKSSPGNNVEDETIMMSSHGSIKKLVQRLDLNRNYILSKYWGFRKMSLYDATPISIGYHENFVDTLSGVIFANLSVKGEAVTIKVKINKDKIGKYKFDKLPASITTPYGEFRFEKTPFFNDYGKSYTLKMEVFGDDLQSEIYQKRLDIENKRKSSDIIYLSTIDDNIGRGKKLLNSIINIHNEENAREKAFVGERTRNFVNKRLEEVNKELELADAEIKAFKEKYGLMDMESDAKGYVELGTELMPLLIEAKSQLESIKLIDSFLADPDNKYAQVPFIVIGKGDNELTKAIVAYNEELAKWGETLQSDKKQSPVSREYDAKSKVLRENLVLALKNTRNGMEITVNNLEKKESELLSKKKDFPIMEKTFLKLKREQEVKQAVYIYLQQKREETSVTSVAISPKLRIVDSPYALNKMASPNLFKIVLIVIFMGGIVLPLLAISMEPVVVSYWTKRRKNKK